MMFMSLSRQDLVMCGAKIMTPYFGSEIKFGTEK